MTVITISLSFPQRSSSLLSLPSIGSKFFDITESVDLPLGPVPKVSMAFPSGPTHQSLVNSLIASIQPIRYRDDLTYLSQNFFTRYYRSTTGVQSAEWLFGRAKAAAFNRTDITVSQFTHSGYDQKSIIARIRGRNANGPVVIIGAHQDSINAANPANRSPGADDNGSGSITVLEVLRVIAESGFVPELPMEFQWYAAEEVGLLGSQAIAQNYKNNGVAVYAMWNTDMTAYTEPGLQIRVIQDNTDPSLTLFTTAIVEEYTDFAWRYYSCGYGCSDHASWNRAGYPSSSIFEPKTNPQIHTASDDLPLVNWEQTTGFVKLALGIIVELSFGA